MVVIVPSRRAQALFAVVVVAAIAMVIDTGSPLLLEHMTANSWPSWAYWAAAGFIALSAVPTYWALLPPGAAQALRSQTK